MIIFITKTGVVCEVDTVNMQARYLIGPSKLEPRPGGQGQWRKYSYMSAPRPDMPVVIDWNTDGVPYVERHRTLTSDVKEIIADPGVALGVVPMRMSKGAPDTVLLTPTEKT